jgi:hypothetical protein
MKVKKVFNLADRQDVLELMKQLYGENEVKDDKKVSDTQRKSGAEGISDVVKLPPNCS